MKEFRSIWSSQKFLKILLDTIWYVRGSRPSYWIRIDMKGPGSCPDPYSFLGYFSLTINNFSLFFFLREKWPLLFYNLIRWLSPVPLSGWFLEVRIFTESGWITDLRSGPVESFGKGFRHHDSKVPVSVIFSWRNRKGLLCQGGPVFGSDSDFSAPRVLSPFTKKNWTPKKVGLGFSGFEFRIYIDRYS